MRPTRSSKPATPRRSSKRKLTDEEAIALYRDHVVHGMGWRRLCRKYHVWKYTIDLLIQGKTYRDVPLVKGKMTLAEWDALK